MWPPRTALLALVLGFWGFAACGDDNRDDSPSVVVTTTQIAALAREVGLDPASIRTLVRPGVDPHDYEPNASDLKAIRGATVVLRHGLGLDDFLEDSLRDARLVAVVTEGIDVRPAAGTDPGQESDEHGEVDPHVWHDPALAAIMTRNIAAKLAAAFPDRAGEFLERADAYARTLEGVDREIAAIIATIPPQNRKMVTNHDAFGYFIRRYGLTFVGAVIPSASTAAEPSVKDIARLQDVIRREGVRAIFAESSIDPKLAEQIARDTGVRVVTGLYVDSLGAPGTGAATVHGMLLENARLIADALR